MRALAPVAPLLLLAACPAKPAQPPITQLQGGVGCPTAAGVFVASYVQPEKGEQSGHTGWVLPLLDKPAAQPGGPEYQQIDTAAATAAGVPAPPPMLWLIHPGLAPCKITYGTFYAAAVEGQTPNVSYGIELTGCPAPQGDDDEAIVLASNQPPSECHIELPHPAAARLGESDAQKRWSPPKNQTPIPPALAAAIPPHDCVAPGCEQLWSIVQVEVENKPVAWGGTVNWLHTTADDQCTWTADTLSGFFVAGADGNPMKVTEGQDHPLILTGVLADRTGPRVLLAEGTGEYTTYDLGGGKATVGRHLVWLVGPTEAYAVDDRIGPECQAAAAKP